MYDDAHGGAINTYDIHYILLFLKKSTSVINKYKKIFINERKNIHQKNIYSPLFTTHNLYRLFFLWLASYLLNCL